jgi:hypothetical protein
MGRCGDVAMWTVRRGAPVRNGKAASNTMTVATFTPVDLEAIDKAKIIGLRAGAGPHRLIGVWVVVVRRRVFVRPWNDRRNGWYRAFLGEPIGLLQVGDRAIRIRARRSRGDRLLDAIDAAYKEKYPTKASQKWVRGFAQPKRRATTLELVPF